MSEPIPDEPGLRLIDSTVVTDPSGQPKFLAEGEDVPTWAKDQVGPHLLPDPPARPSGPVTDMGHVRARDQHMRPNLIDVVCFGRPNKPHGRVDLARFETTLLAGHRPGPHDDNAEGWAAREVWEWDLVFDPRLHADQKTARAAAGLSGPTRAVRLRCTSENGCKLDLERRWDHWEVYLNDQRHTGAPEVTLLDAIRAATTRGQ